MVKKRQDKKEDKGQGFIDLIFSWSIADIMNKDLYKNKVNRIPDTFLSAEHYLKSFIHPLIEETHADLRSNFTTIRRAPACEIIGVKRCKGFEVPKKLSYKLSLKPGMYEPEFGDLIALTEVRPKFIDDLHRPKRSYVIALFEGRKESSFEIPILSSKPISFEKEDEEKGKAGDKLFAVYLTNLTTNMRIWRALHSDLDGGNMKIINSVLSTNLSVADNCDLCSSNEIQSFNMSKSMKAIESIGLDDSQKIAVLKCIATSKCQHQNSVKLIWGPPGTGKTKTISGLVFSLLRMKCRTLTCAPTNVAVLGVTKRLMSLLTGTLAYETYGIGDIVLFGNGERMKIHDHGDLFNIFLDRRVSVLADCFAPLTGWKGSLESMIGLLEDFEGQFQRYIKIELEKNNETQKRMLQRKSWKVLINHELNKDKKENSPAKTPSHSRTRSKCGENYDNKNGKTEENNNEKVLLTFDEFFTKTFRKFEQKLLLCMKRLYTHMPTSCLTFEVLKNMIIVRDMLQTLQSLLNHFDASNNLLRQALHGDEGICRIRLECLEAMNILQEKFSLPNFIQDFQIRNFCLANTCLIFCTASGSAKLHTEGMKPIHLVIIDEAAQLKECESSIPLQLPGACHAILVGDEKQLPAMVQSKICERAEFGRSLFERLAILGHSKHLLNVQYRMHPSISLFPNREFYGKQISDGRNVLERSYMRQYLKGNIFGSYSFIDVPNGKEGFDDRQSPKNLVEVSVLAEIVSKIYQDSIVSKQKVRIGCISPYKAQVSAIQERLGNSYSSDAADKFSVNVRSVDGFQGGEEDLIIISTVRCNGNGTVGFLSNCQRANVALTRAKYCLWILGNGATLLNSSSIWKKLVLDAKSRGCFYNACEDGSLAKAIALSLFELGHQNSLFNMDSILFKKSKWKVCFSAEFQESFKKFQELGIEEEAISLVVKLSNGLRQIHKDKTLSFMEGMSSQLVEFYDLNAHLKLIWTTDILREDSMEIQVIKILDVLPLNEIPKLAKKLEVLFGNYSIDFMNRCLSKRIEGDLTLPMTWPVVENIKGPNASLELANKLSVMSVRDETESSARSSVVGERAVKKLRLSKALKIPEGTTVSDACRRMAARRVDTVLLTDANALLSGIVTDKDIATRVIADELRPEQTIISKVMTRNPIFVNSDSLAIEALQKMVQGKFRHLPVVENGEVIALLDITKCFYDAISRMEKAAEQGSAIAAAVEGVERQFGSNFSETLRERIFKPSLSTIISENSRVAIVSPSDPVHVAAKKMRELQVNSVLIMTGNKIQGILTSKDILMRVVAQNLSPELTLVEKVMTQNPECVTLETTILEALHIMHDGKFLHLPVVDKDGGIAACVDVLQLTHAAISMVESGSGTVNDVANTVMQKFWDSALNLDPPDDYDTHSEMSISQYMASDGTEHVKSTYPSLGLGNSFSFKFEDHNGRVHRFNFGMENLDELVSAVMQRVGAYNDQNRPQLLYEDDEGDRVLLTTDGDLVSAVSHARSVGLKVLRLHLDYYDASRVTMKQLSDSETGGKAGFISLRTGIFAGAVALSSVGVLIYLKRTKL